MRAVARPHREEVARRHAAELGDESIEQEARAERAAEVPRAQPRDRERVRRAPRLRLELEPAQLERARRARRRDLGEPRVHARRVGVERGARVARELLLLAVGRGAEAERAGESIGVERARPDQLRQLPARAAPQHLHLPEPVLRVREAERAVRVDQVRRVDVRNAERVAHDVCARGQARHLELALRARARIAAHQRQHHRRARRDDQRGDHRRRRRDLHPAASRRRRFPGALEHDLRERVRARVGSAHEGAGEAARAASARARGRGSRARARARSRPSRSRARRRRAANRCRWPSCRPP